MGSRMIEYVFDKYQVDLEKNEVQLVQDLVLGKYKKHPESKCDSSTEAWLFDIVSNKRNSIDVDKFDYIQRDTRMLGTP